MLQTGVGLPVGDVDLSQATHNQLEEEEEETNFNMNLIRQTTYKQWCAMEDIFRTQQRK